MSHESRKALASLRGTLADANNTEQFARCAEDALALSESLLSSLEKTEESLRIGSRASEETMALHARERQHFQQLESTLYALEGRGQEGGATPTTSYPQEHVDALGQQLAATNLVLTLTQHERDAALAANAALVAQSRHSLSEAVEEGRRAEDALASALVTAKEAGIERDAALALAGGLRGQLEAAQRQEVAVLKALHSEELQGERVRYVEAMERHREMVATLDARIASLIGAVNPLQEEVTTLRSTSMGVADDVARAKAEAGAAREEAARLRVAVLGSGLKIIGTGADIKLVPQQVSTAAAAAAAASPVGRGGSQHPSSPSSTSSTSTSTSTTTPYQIMSPGDSQLHLPTLRAAFTHVSLRLAEVEAVAARLGEEAARAKEGEALARAAESNMAVHVVALREELERGVEEGRVRGEELAATLAQCQALSGEVEGLKGALASAHLEDVHQLRGEVAVAKWGEREAYRKLNLVLGIPSHGNTKEPTFSPSKNVTLGAPALPTLPMSPPPTHHRGRAAGTSLVSASGEGGGEGVDSPLPLSSTIPFASPPSAWVPPPPLPPPPTFTATSSAYWQSLKARARGDEGAVFAGSASTTSGDALGERRKEEEEEWIGKGGGGQGMSMGVGGGGDGDGGGLPSSSTTPLAGGSTRSTWVGGDLSTRPLSSLPSTPTAALLSAAKIRQAELLKWRGEANRLTDLRVRYTLGRSLTGAKQ